MKFKTDDEFYEEDSENLEEIIENIQIEVNSIEEELYLQEDFKEEHDVEFEEDDFIKYKININKHKVEGSHALKRDTIFNGKINPQLEETTFFENIDNIVVEENSLTDNEHRDNYQYNHNKNLLNDIYVILKENTNIDFVSNRRKPNKETFNIYYEILLKELNKKYSKSEIFVELSYYFTDNIFNMYKLLNKEHAINIIKELKNNGYLKNLNNLNFV